MNESGGVLPFSAKDPAVVGIPVVSMLSLTITGIPSSGALIAVSARAVRGAGVGDRGGAGGDDRVQLRVQQR